MFVLEKLVKGLTSSSCEVGISDSYALIVNKINSLNLEALKSDSIYYDRLRLIFEGHTEILTNIGDFSVLLEDLRIFLLAQDFRVRMYETPEVVALDWTRILCVLVTEIEGNLQARRIFLRLARYLKMRSHETCEHLKDLPSMILNTLNRILTRHPADPVLLSFCLQVIKDYCGVEECQIMPIEDSLLKILRFPTCNDKLKAMTIKVLADKFECPFDRVMLHLPKGGQLSAVLAASLKIYYNHTIDPLTIPKSSSRVLNLINGFAELDPNIKCEKIKAITTTITDIERSQFITRNIYKRVIEESVDERDFQELHEKTNFVDSVKSGSLPFQVYAFRMINLFKSRLEPNELFQLTRIAEKCKELYKENFDGHLYICVFEGFLVNRQEAAQEEKSENGPLCNDMC